MANVTIYVRDGHNKIFQEARRLGNGKSLSQIVVEALAEWCQRHSEPKVESVPMRLLELEDMAESIRIQVLDEQDNTKA